MPIADDDPRPTAAEARWFGVLLLAVFALFGSIVGWQLESPRFTLGMISIGAALALLYSLIRPLRVPLFRSWMSLVAPLGRLISTGVLGLVYFLKAEMSGFPGILRHDSSDLICFALVPGLAQSLQVILPLFILAFTQFVQVFPVVQP